MTDTKKARYANTEPGNNCPEKAYPNPQAKSKKNPFGFLQKIRAISYLISNSSPEDVKEIQEGIIRRRLEKWGSNVTD